MVQIFHCHYTSQFVVDMLAASFKHSLLSVNVNIGMYVCPHLRS